ncbi:MAG: hypothetical protein O7D94_04615 [Planctomycetota bacterium]|nr:hypothetical protein [Planctomycetota bacterium]
MIRPVFKWTVAAVVATAGIALSSSAALAASDDKIIASEGRAAGTGLNAREQAKQDALRRAVEQACGTFISSKTKVKNYQAVYDKAMSFAAGYIKKYEVLDQGTRGEISFCNVRATVSTAEFEKEWARLTHTIEAEGNPRCIVVVVEDNDMDDLIPAKTDGVSEGVIEHFFLDKGVQLMDEGASENVRTRDLELAARNNDINKMAAMGAAFKADVILRGVAEARRAGTSTIGGRTVYKWTATISIRAYHTDSAQLIMSDTYSATKTTVNANQGGDDALRACAEKHVAKILRDIGESWRKRQNVRRISQVVLENCSKKDYKAFARALSEVGGVQSVKLRELVNDVCQVEVDWSYDLERLVGRIESLEVPGTSYEVTEQTRDRVTIKVVK